MILFVVPAFNEEQNIGRLIEETDVFAKRESLDYRLIVVDDGSTDKTREIVEDKMRSFPCLSVSYKSNQGVGEAFRQGLHKALGLAREGDTIVTKEADRTSDLGILKKLLAKIDSGADVALASCYAEGGAVEGTTWYRLMYSRVANLIIYVCFNIKGIHTYSSFYRAYKPQALRRILTKYGDFYQEKGFACVIELLIRLSRLRMKIEEVPMTLQANLRVGQSKMKIMNTIFGYLRVIARNVFIKP